MWQFIFGLFLGCGIGFLISCFLLGSKVPEEDVSRKSNEIAYTHKDESKESDNETNLSK